MTVGELIAKLSSLDLDLEVVSSGETDYANVLNVVTVEEWPCTFDGDQSYVKQPAKVVNLIFSDGSKYSSFPFSPK